MNQTRRPDAEWLEERHEAEQVPCPECDVAAGEHCINTQDGLELGRFPAHWRRIKAADKETR